ncbi:MAG: rRNA cytosine-C5-methyltransferase [Tannerella sp.]|jgi:16S rRNA C967 or C1407 C5-methylase (RsmB/RsmF family)/NOL1/NOP2/fmu family ribosome biogenesis protein|nr:rRNA cytosine-C5-methyltransferase [Tannerella sp.]
MKETLPQEFIARMKALLKDEYEAFEAALEEPPPVSIRINPMKTNHSNGDPIPWCSTGYYLPERPSFTFDPLFHAGIYYVQEASSMFLEQIVKKTGGKTVLDLCAAPGGKSTHLTAILPEESLLVSNEVVRSRCNILTENMHKWGAPNVIITNNDPRDFKTLRGVFDLILADLPCSGEGMFRKDPASRAEWSLNNIRLCAERQRRIVRDVWDALRPGGYLIYSTCTYNLEENEDNIRQLAEQLNARIIPVHPGMTVKKFFPHKAKGEGFSIAILQKDSGDELPNAKKFKPLVRSLNYPEASEWLKHPEDYFIDARGDKLYAISLIHKYLYQSISENMKVLSAGIPLATLKGRDLIPSPALALNSQFSPAPAFPKIPLTFDDAIKYFRRESLTLPADTPKGFVLVTYENHPLGFMKNLGARANNLYPQEWRIRATSNPQYTCKYPFERVPAPFHPAYKHC